MRSEIAYDPPDQLPIFVCTVVRFGIQTIHNKAHWFPLLNAFLLDICESDTILPQGEETRVDCYLDPLEGTESSVRRCDGRHRSVAAIPHASPDRSVRPYSK